MQSRKLVLLLLSAFAFHSCFKEDEMIEPLARGDVQSDTLEMTQNYLYQIYFSLDSGKIVHSNLKSAYDLGFECTQTGWHVILNTSDFMKVADLGEVPFGEAYDTTGLKMRFDKSDGNPDSIAVGQWYSVAGSDTISNRHVYALSRGLDEMGNPLGLYQVIFDSLKNGAYYFRYASLNGGALFSGKVVKNRGVNYMFFSLQTGAVVQVEPQKETYDLLFTQYTTMLFTDQGIPYPYLVTGALSNRNKTEIAVDSTYDFSAITREVALTGDFTNSLDAIGYDWKYYSFKTSAYTIRKNRNYIVHVVSGDYFKLRFIGFYNKKGEKGYPVIEYQRL
jgi:hypothetical protein